DPNPDNNSATASENPQSADLVLVKRVSDPRPNVGDTITFTMQRTETGREDDANVTLSDALPAGVTFLSFTASQGSYDPGTQTWTVGTVAAGTTATLTITAQVTSPNPVANTASISHADQFDPDTGNNTAFATVTPQQADLQLTKAVSDPRPNVGDTITFTVT